MMKAAAEIPGASPVPGFLAKLWALVEDSGSDDVIAWSRDGQNFCILDEQRFAKELLPKYFKHNNLSSFIRQLNIYGFRKVIALENGMLTSEKSSAIEFQHPFFKRGKANLLANIKRKVSAVRTEDRLVCSEELHKVLAEVQEMREQQNNMDLKLASMKRENQALWKEVASLRQKHSQQQQLLSKILEFILGLMRGNCILGLKRKRPLADASGASPSKYSRQYVHIPVKDREAAAISEHSADCEDSIIICDITDAPEEDGAEKLLAFAHPSNGNWEAQLPTRDGVLPCKASETSETELPGSNCCILLEDDPVKAPQAVGSNAVELHSAQAGSTEDPAAMIDSILNQTVAQSDTLLDREEMQDFLNCIDASLEELQAMLSGKKSNYSPEMSTDAINPELPALDVNLAEVPPGLENDGLDSANWSKTLAASTSDVGFAEDLPGSVDAIGMNEQELSGKNDMQLIQYRGNPLLSLFEEPPLNDNASKMGDAQDILLASLEDRPSIPPPPNSEAPLQLLGPANLSDGTTELEHPLLTEDMNGEYKLFPLLLLSPVANFIEEASEIETS